MVAHRDRGQRERITSRAGIDRLADQPLCVGRIGAGEAAQGIEAEQADRAKVGLGRIACVSAHCSRDAERTLEANILPLLGHKRGELVVGLEQRPQLAELPLRLLLPRITSLGCPIEQSPLLDEQLSERFDNAHEHGEGLRRSVRSFHQLMDRQRCIDAFDARDVEGEVTSIVDASRCIGHERQLLGLHRSARRRPSRGTHP